ncbi:MAG: ribulose phosphate epimerase [Nannocystaceae bacterium]|nr:ribulose phosphate epimerase [bacterium]
MRLHRVQRTLAKCGLVATLLVACESRVQPQAGEGSTSSSTSAASTTGGDVEPVGTTASTPGTTTGTTDPPEPSSGTGEPGCEFLCPGDVGSASIQCDVWQQDCPAGEKCTPWASQGMNWNETRCVPVDASPDAPGDPCTRHRDGVGGLDSCDVGALCWDVDDETNQGTCVPLCVGDANEPLCADPNRVCQISSEAILNLCVLLCDPLDASPCPQGHGCYPRNDGFACAPDASAGSGGTFEPCEFSNACQPGLVCVEPDAVVQCGDGAPGCCTPVCDVQAPVCPEPTVCVPWYDGSAPPGYDDVGSCIAAQE